MRITVIINPISGAGGRVDAGASRARLAAAFLDTHQIDHELLVTERPGHGFDLARGAVTRGATVVCAWGGDGTVNEVAAALAFTPAALAIIPAGSGNGLARELRIPKQPAAALAVAVSGDERSIDAGELAGRIFVNLAGIGFDAEIARRFADRAPGRRGFIPYLTIAASQALTYEPATYSIAVGARRWRQRAFMIVLANARQYGNGAVIAPGAAPDDGWLDLVIVHDVSLWRILSRIPAMFRGTLAEEAGVITMLRFEEAEISSDENTWLHADGEAMASPASVRARVLPNALRVRVPSRKPTADRLTADS